MIRQTTFIPQFDNHWFKVVVAIQRLPLFYNKCRCALPETSWPDLVHPNTIRRYITAPAENFQIETLTAWVFKWTFLGRTPASFPNVSTCLLGYFANRKFGARQKKLLGVVTSHRTRQRGRPESGPETKGAADRSVIGRRGRLHRNVAVY